ncbi:hypothetical protein [Sporosarcina sp. FSL K6-3457]|uniref:hypothetical protein n=1 Tax=Sporosarcina sp. FSL K6-3457 TaxID=2978204 RepID=UPI0030F71381
MDKKKTGKKAFMGMRKGIVTGVALILMGTSTTVLASQDTGYINELFGGITNSFVKDQHNQVVIESGVKMKIEESLSGGKSSFIIVSFEKEDKTEFPDGAAITNLELGMKHGASYLIEQQLTEDRKQIIAKFDIDTFSSIEGKKVTINAQDIVNTDTDEIIANGPFETKFTAHDRSSKIEIDLTLKQQEEEVVLKTLHVSAIGIELEGERIDGQASYLPEMTPIVKVVTNDNQIIQLNTDSTSTTDIGFKWKYSLNADGNRLFLDKATINKIMINDQVISVN